MVSQNSLALLASGLSPKRIADGRRLQEKQNALAEILNQQQINRNDALLRGTQLDNTAKARTIAASMQPQAMDPEKQARIDNLRSQIEERNRKANQPQKIELSKSKQALIDFLPPELQVDPAQATTKDFILAAKLKAEQKNKPKEFKPTADQGKATGFYDRMVAAQGEIDSLGDFNPIAMGEVLGSISNVTKSPERQRYDQAKSDWVRAKLRKESGAVIGDEEMASEISTYFPEWGDSPEVIAQKARARKVAEQAMFNMSGQKADDSAGPLQAGQVEDGYRFKGGNPADPNSWEPV